MNKTELIKAVSNHTEIDQDTVRKVFNGIIFTIKDRLWYGVDVKIKDFLNFTLTIRNEVNRRNPKTD